MTVIGTYAAKTKFTGLLRRVARGEQITISRHGVPVATLRAFESSKSRPLKEIIRDIRHFRIGRKLKGLTLRAMVEEGRR